MTNQHNVTTEADTALQEKYTGTRWWYVFGEWPVGEECEWHQEDGVQPVQLATKIRRIFRRWRKANEAKAFVEMHKGTSRSNSWLGSRVNTFDLWAAGAGKARKSLRPGGSLHWLNKGGGFLLFMDIHTIDKLLTYASAEVEAN